MRYAAYIRSCTNEPETSSPIDTQRQAVRAWVNTQGGELVGIYIDPHHAGNTMDRPALQQMLEDAAKGRFDGVIVQSLDRLSRNRAVIDTIHRRLSQYHITLFAVREKEIYA